VSVHGQRVILAADLARIYGVETRMLNQAVKRNAARFPPDFSFRLTRQDATRIERSRSQSVILKRGANIKYLPLAFTEHGVLMAASILNSPRAVEMSIFVVRAFIRLRAVAQRYAELAAKIDALERRVGGHDEDLEQMFTALRALIAPARKAARQIGFGRPPIRASLRPAAR
jgi:ORF6N domain-containing protein